VCGHAYARMPAYAAAGHAMPAHLRELVHEGQQVDSVQLLPMPEEQASQLCPVRADLNLPCEQDMGWLGAGELGGGRLRACAGTHALTRAAYIWPGCPV